MAGESVGKIFSYIVFTLTIVAAIMILLLKIGDSQDTFVRNQTTSFVDTCRTTGEINPDKYRAYYKSVYGMGSYTISMERKQLVSYPNVNAAGNPDGTSRDEWYITNMRDIMAYMYDLNATREQSYPLNAGDMFTVEVRKKQADVGSRMLSFFTGGADNRGAIVVKYSGVVGSNGV